MCDSISPHSICRTRKPSESYKINCEANPSRIIRMAYSNPYSPVLTHVSLCMWYTVSFFVVVDLCYSGRGTAQLWRYLSQLLQSIRIPFQQWQRWHFIHNTAKRDEISESIHLNYAACSELYKLEQWFLTFKDPFENLMKAIDPLPRKMHINRIYKNIGLVNIWL